MMFIKRFVKSTAGFYIVVTTLLGVIWFLVAKYVPGDLKSNLIAEVIGAGITVIIIGGLLRIWYPPLSKSMSKFLIPQLNYCLFFYVRDLGFLLQYQFNNTGFKGISSIDLSTYGIFLKNNLSKLKQHLENRKDTTYTVNQINDMNRMFRSFHERIDQFIAHYGRCLDESALASLYEIRHICDYQSFYTTMPSDIQKESQINMGREISDDPMREILDSIERIMSKIDDGNVFRKEPLPI